MVAPCTGQIAQAQLQASHTCKILAIVPATNSSRRLKHWYHYNYRQIIECCVCDECSCLVARRLSHMHGHRHLDWVYVLNRIPQNASHCWRQLARSLHSNQSGHRQVHPGQTLLSPGLSLALPRDKHGAMELRAGNQRVLLLPSIQALWNLQDQNRGFTRDFRHPLAFGLDSGRHDHSAPGLTREIGDHCGARL